MQNNSNLKRTRLGHLWAVGLLLLTGACSHSAVVNRNLSTSDEINTAATTGIDAATLANVVASYKTYVTEEAQQLVVQTGEFTAAIKAGDLRQAQRLYARTRQHYERIEPVAELFADLDGSIDARADDFAKKEQDPAWTGFHRLELALFREQTTTGLAPLADRLNQDVQELQRQIPALKIKPKVMVTGATELIEEVSSKKIVGEENRYSGADLSDFQANLQGSQQIIKLLRPEIARADAQLLTRIEANFAKISAGIGKYRRPGGEFNGFANYKQLTESDRKLLQTNLAALAEDLSLLRGVLGV